MDAGSAGAERVRRGFVTRRAAELVARSTRSGRGQSGSSGEHHSDSLCGTSGREVIGEVELASRYLKGRIVAITGSNGKTTTTSLIGELLRDAGLTVQVGGNIGKALISMVESSSDDGWTVVELSSFQLETIKTFHPSIAVVLNVTPNHMDRYETFNDYAAAKHRIFMNQTPGDVAVLNADDRDGFVVGKRVASEGDELQRQAENSRRSFPARP